MKESNKQTVKQWFQYGEPWIWMNAAALAISIIAVVGLIALLTVKGMSHFWPKDIADIHYEVPMSVDAKGQSRYIRVIGEIVSSEEVSYEQLKSAGITFSDQHDFYNRSLIKLGNRDITGVDFGWFFEKGFTKIEYPESIVAIERYEWGNFYGFLTAIKDNGEVVVSSENYEVLTAELWEAFETRLQQSTDLFSQIRKIEKNDIGAINAKIEKIRLQYRQLELDSLLGDEVEKEKQQLAIKEKSLNDEYEALQKNLVTLYEKINRNSFMAVTMDGTLKEINFSKVVNATRPNSMGLLEKFKNYVINFWNFIADDPREANTEGGIFPAIFGTIMMVMLMSVIVTPFGVIAAIYLKEYAKQGVTTRIIRIAVNNLAGVPSIVYGIFGLGFFVYFIGGNIDELFFKAALPSPTFGTPGLMWASLTLALLTLPVVIVATEEGLSRVPKSLREGSLALGATKSETLWKIIIPMASPAMMTGLILAVARAAGEVAPLMLVGVVKLAPSLAVDSVAPFLHLDRKFMHMGFHIYDVGFQSPNVEAARPLVYATALLLVIIIALLNVSAIAIRNNLREKYKSLE